MTAYAPVGWAPAVDPATLDAVVRGLTGQGVQVTRSEVIGRWTTLGVGGAAQAYAEITDEAQLTALMTVLAETDEEQLPLLVMGRGSNMVVADAGWPGLAVRLGASFKTYLRTGNRVSAGAGASMPALAAWAATQGLSGLEFAAGIPATVGGSVRMNAGAHGGEVADRLVGVDVAVPGKPSPVRYSAAQLEFSYRHSVLPPRAVIAATEWELDDEDPQIIRDRLDELRAWRRRTQPLRQRNCGSVFANPPGDSAGRLVEAAGLKGHRRGGAQVSERHANFIVVEPPCAAFDVYSLIALMRRAVFDGGGPLLEPEVRLIGDFSVGGPDVDFTDGVSDGVSDGG